MYNFELVTRYNQSDPPIMTILEVEKALTSTFKACEIPLTFISSQDYLHDEEVNETFIYKLFTITDKNVLKVIQTEEDREVLDDALLVKIRGYFEHIGFQLKAESSEVRVYNKLIHQHNNGTRVSILLEKESEDTVSHFKVYGFASTLISYLHAHVGVGGMVRDDLHNQEFQLYLEALAENGVI
ncbi:hypothetical protein ACI2JA_11145 [Alkalihalobacillus sp. NPDC078783]